MFFYSGLYSLLLPRLLKPAATFRIKWPWLIAYRVCQLVGNKNYVSMRYQRWKAPCGLELFMKKPLGSPIGRIPMTCDNQDVDQIFMTKTSMLGGKGIDPD